ncbi:MAG: ACT domain-containing protein [Candidatus Bipolaricaulia bacterium]
MLAEDSDEITCIAPETSLRELRGLIRCERSLRLLEVRVSVPFQAPGFLARIATALAAEGISILIVSTFSKDYVLVRDSALLSATEALRRAGFSVTTSGLSTSEAECT